MRRNILRIMLVDSSGVILRGLRALLETRSRWRVCGEASDGFEAIEKSEKLRPDLVIMGLRLPGLNGIEATREIRRIQPWVRVLAYAVDDSVESVRDALSAGVGGYVLKSDAESELLKAIEALALKKTFFSASVSETLSRIQRDLRRHRQESLSVVRRLTLREREVLRLLAEGKRNREVAGRLGISIRTVETHRARIMKKLGVKTIGELVRYAVRRRMVES